MIKVTNQECISVSAKYIPFLLQYCSNQNTQKEKSFKKLKTHQKKKKKKNPNTKPHLKHIHHWFHITYKTIISLEV